MKNIFLLFIFLISPCTVASETVTDAISIAGIELQLVESAGKCYLINKNKKSALQPKPPCHFLRNSDSTPQYYSYPKSNIDATLIVSGSPISDSIRNQWGISSGLVCGFLSQGVLIQDGIASPTKKILEGGVLCKDQGSDEKNYWYFAH